MENTFLVSPVLVRIRTGKPRWRSPWSISQQRAQDPSTDPDSTAPDPPSWGLAQGAHGAHRALPNPKSTKCTSEHPNSWATFLSATQKRKPPRPILSLGPTRSVSRCLLLIYTLLKHPCSNFQVISKLTTNTQPKTALQGGLALPKASGLSPSWLLNTQPHRQRCHK